MFAFGFKEPAEKTGDDEKGTPLILVIIRAVVVFSPLFWVNTDALSFSEKCRVLSSSSVKKM